MIGRWAQAPLLDAPNHLTNLIIADDLMGACDAALPFASRSG
jgi:hypothetical protein